MAPSIHYSLCYIKQCINACGVDRPVFEKMMIATCLFNYLATPTCLTLLTKNQRFREVVQQKIQELTTDCEEHRTQASTTEDEGFVKDDLVNASLNLEVSLAKMQHILLENPLE